MLKVIKSDGNKEEFCNEKLKKGIIAATNRTTAYFKTQHMNKFFNDFDVKIKRMREMLELTSIKEIDCAKLKENIVCILKCLSANPEHKKVGAQILNEYQCYSNLKYSAIKDTNNKLIY